MTQPNPTSKPRPIRVILLLLAVITSPLFCCGAVQLLDALPDSLIPSGLNFIVNIFESEARVENRTSETFYLTAITTTYGEPRVISQNISFRQRDIPLKPNGSVALQYDSADMPLAGIAVCRSAEDCRLLARDYSDVYVLESYETLPNLEPGWIQAIKSYPLHNYSTIVILVLSLVPVLLFLSWVRLVRAEKIQTASIAA